MTYIGKHIVAYLIQFVGSYQNQGITIEAILLSLDNKYYNEKQATNTINIRNTPDY